MAYKAEQGRMARMAAFWTLAALGFYGCLSLRQELIYYFPSLGDPISGIRLPIVGVDLTPALLIIVLVCATIFWLLYRWLDRPKYADLLIETEHELKKVTWPSIEEAINGSVVVIICVLFLMAYLAGADWFLARLARVVLLGTRS